jgi:hypothetical protein
LILARPAVVSHGGAAAVIALDRDRYEIMVGPGTAEYLLVLRRRGGDLEGQGYFPVNDVGGAYLHTLSTDGKAPVFALVVIKKVDSDPLPATTR